MSLTMQEWIFKESFGRYDLDLGDSNVDLADLRSLPGLDDIASIPLGYGHEAGLPALRSAIAELYPHAAARNVLVSHGAQEAFSLLIRSLDPRPRGEALVMGSGWTQHSVFPAEAGMTVRTIDLSPDAEELLTKAAEAISWRTQVIVVASPDNPTGWTATVEFLAGLAEIADAYDALLIVDEEYVIDTSYSMACTADSVAIVSGLSKLHGLPGLRLGWCIASADAIARCTERKHLTTISNSVLCESIALAVLENNGVFIDRARELCGTGSRILREWAVDHPMVEVLGSTTELPFAWLYLGEETDSLALARRLLGDGILVVPGEVFGQPHHLRIAIGRPASSLARGLERLGHAITAEGCSSPSAEAAS
jgi:aspartate/methionine/tyrosine aminotransferase